MTAPPGRRSSLLYAPEYHHRIIITGTTGSGKTTLARQLAEQLAIPHIELDALYWEPNWTPASTEVFRQRVAQALSGETWVADGNYSSARDLIWGRAELLIWLDYPLLLILWRLLKRGIQRSIRKVELWHGNRDTLRGVFFSPNSLWLYALKTHFRRRKEYPAAFAAPEYAPLTVIHLRSPRATEDWLASIPPPPSPTRTLACPLVARAASPRVSQKPRCLKQPTHPLSPTLFAPAERRE
jgi:adenylate kinase family enzyme